MRKLALWFSSSLCLVVLLCGCASGGGSGSGSTPKAPVANAGGPYTGKTAAAVSFSGSGSSDPQGDALTYAWSFGDGATGTGVGPTHTYTALGSYTVSLTVTNTSNLTATATTTATISGQPPVANAGGPYTGKTETAVSFSGSGSSDPQGEALSYAWNFGDGSTGTGVSPTHSYTVPGTYTVSLTITNASNLTATATATAIIAGQPPVANAGGPYTSKTETAISFNGSGSSDPQGETLTYTWNFGDSSTGTGVSPTHTYTAPGTYIVSLIVADTSKLTSTASTTAVIAAQPPTANAGGPYNGGIGAIISFNGKGSSDPQGEPLTYAWNFGDGTTGTGAISTHAYTAPQTYNVSLIVTNTSNLTATTTTTAAIVGQNPAANVGGPYAGDIGTIISFSGIGSNDPQGEALTYAWSFGDGTTGTGISPTHTYTTPGTYTVSLTVTDTSNLTATASTTATIAGQPPAANAGGPYTGGIGTIISFSGSKSNDPQGEALTYAWDFGDGTTGTGVSPTHAYTALGTYTVSLTVTDTANLTATASATVTIEATTINIKGVVSGGTSPISGATIALYAAGSKGNGSAPTAVPTFLEPVVTDSNGNFDVTADYACVNVSDQMYLVATGGSPDPNSSANNAALELMAPLGRCDQLSSVTSVTLNEVTTVASAWALSQFLSPGGNMGASSTNVQGLANAVITANNLVNIATGTSPGAALPANVTVSTSKLNMLANALASCVNSVGGANCSSLLTDATAGGVTPSNTLDAALNIARNPASNVSAIYTLAAANTVFASALPSAPPDWMLYATLTGGGMDGNQVAAIAVDSGGNVWVSTYGNGKGISPTAYVAKFSPNGTPASADGFSGNGLNQIYSMALDANDNVWTSNEQTTWQIGSGYIAELSSSGQPITGMSNITAGGINYPLGIATDTNGTVWVADSNLSHVTLLSTTGTAISPAPGFGGGFVEAPVWVAVDANHNAWVGNTGAGPLLTRISPDGTQVVNLNCCFDAHGIAVDRNGDVWTANSGDSSVSLITNTSAATPTVSGNFLGGGGLYTPNGIAVDGAGNVWVTNYDSAPGSLSELAGSNATSPGIFLSPDPIGFGSDASMLLPYGVAVDASGNLWVSNTGNDTVTEFIGAAVPVKTPLVGPVQLP